MAAEEEGESNQGSEFDDTLGCPVCFEMFGTEKNIPRLLLCSHTLCESCIVEMLKGRRFLVCPQCRKRQTAYSGVNAFPQNKYILKSLVVKEEPFAFEFCPHHKRELSLFCKSNVCKKDICQLCYLQRHGGHHVVDIVQDENDKAKRRLDPINEYLVECKKTLVAAKQKVRGECRNTLEELNSQKDVYMRMFDSEIEKVTKLMTTEEREIDQQLEVVKEQFVKCTDINNKIESGTKDKDIKRRKEMIDAIELESKKIFSEKDSYKFYQCQKGIKGNISNICPELADKTERMAVPPPLGEVKAENLNNVTDPPPAGPQPKRHC